MEQEDEAARLRLALDLCDAGCLMQRQKLRRANPTLGEEEIERLLQDWLNRPEDGEVDPPLRLRRAPRFSA